MYFFYILPRNLPVTQAARQVVKAIYQPRQKLRSVRLCSAAADAYHRPQTTRSARALVTAEFPKASNGSRAPSPVLRIKHPIWPQTSPDTVFASGNRIARLPHLRLRAPRHQRKPPPAAHQPCGLDASEWSHRYGNPMFSWGSPACTHQPQAVHESEFAV